MLARKMPSVCLENTTKIFGIKNMLPQLEIHKTEEDIKYILFSQNEVISDEIRANGYWNKHILDIAANILQTSKEGGLVIDVGAGFGSFSIPLALTHKNFNFKAFEPLKVVFWQLCANALLNNLYNIRTFDKVVSSESGTRVLGDIDYASSSNHGSFSFNADVNIKRGIVANESVEHRYELAKIDDFSFNNVVLLKISACGLELNAIQGAKETIERNFNPPIILEIWHHDWYSKEKELCLNTLKEYGYKHIHDAGGHVVAFKTEEHYLICNSEIKSVANYGGFNILEEPNVVADTLENQIPYLFTEESKMSAVTENKIEANTISNTDAV